MGFFSNLDQMVVELIGDGCKDDDVVEIVRMEYNGLISEDNIRETIDTVRMRDYDDPYYPYPG